jgi:hypothetical protein
MVGRPVGRPPKIPNQARKAVLKKFNKLRKRKCGTTAAQLRAACFALRHVTLRTVQRLLCAAGFRYRNRSRKSALAVVDHQERLRWARAHLQFRWSRVTCYADMKFFRIPLSIWDGPRSARVWARPGEAHAAWAVDQPRRMLAPGAKVFGAIVTSAFYSLLLPFA